MPRSNSKQSGNPCSKYLSRKKGRAIQWERFVEKEGFISLERKSEWVMEYQITRVMYQDCY